MDTTDRRITAHVFVQIQTDDGDVVERYIALDGSESASLPLGDVAQIIRRLTASPAPAETTAAHPEQCPTTPEGDAIARRIVQLAGI